VLEQYTLNRLEFQSIRWGKQADASGRSSCTGKTPRVAKLYINDEDMKHVASLSQSEER
jgi:hypothetical protein